MKLHIGLACASLLLVAGPARAAEPEPVRLEVQGSAGCVEEASLREEIGVLGARFRDANLDDRARTFRIETAQADDGVSGRLVVRDLVHRETVREIRARSCLEATRTLALFAATALDEAPNPPPPAPSEPPSPTPAPLPAPAVDMDRTPLERAPRLGSGGVTFGGLGGVAAGVSAGFRATAAFRVGGTTRLGLAGAIVHDDRATSTSGGGYQRSRGIASRAGLLVGWGAPWNDAPVGFATELGVAWGTHRGVAYPPESNEPCFAVAIVSATPCFDESNGAPAHWMFVSPYVAPQVVFQVPFKDVSVRPIASLGMSWGPVGPGGILFAVTGEMGIVWQAW